MTYQIFLFFTLLGSSCGGFLSKEPVLVKSVTYAPCTGLEAHPGTVMVRDANIVSTAEGDLLVSGAISTAVNLTSPIQAKVNVYRRLLGIEVPVPCIKEHGSCNYPDLCIYGIPIGERCPGALDENDVPCRCPIKEGLYSLPGGQFRMSPTRLASLIAGRYTGTAKFYAHDGKMLACYNFFLVLE